MDFDQVRPYQPGDDVRTIDWRVTARTTRTHTKVFCEERERPVTIIVDLRQSMFFGTQRCKSVTACLAAATLAWAGLHAGDRIGALVFSPTRQQDIRARRSRHCVLQLIRILCESSAALIERQPDSFSLNKIFEDARHVIHPGSTVVFISDFYDFNHAGQRHLFELSRHCDITLCHVIDDLDISLPPAGNYPVNDGRRRFTLNSRDNKSRKAFELNSQKQIRALQTAAGTLQASYLQLNTSQPVIPLLQKVYGNKAARQRTH
jgi:hypothetical protein